jgi:hypothetical protein
MNRKNKVQAMYPKKTSIFATVNFLSPLDLPFITEDAHFVPYASGAELVSLLLFMRANTLWRSEGMKETPIALLLIRSLFALSLLNAGAILFGRDVLPFYVLSRTEIFVLFLGMYGGFGLLLFAKSLANLPSKLVFFGGTVHLLSGTILGYLVLHEAISPARWVILCILASIQAVVFWKDRSTWLAMPWTQRIVPFFIGFIWGTYYPFFGLAQNSLGTFNTLILTEYGVILTMSMAFIIKIRSEHRGFRLGIHYREMGEQAFLSVMAQGFTALCIGWGGVVLHSILTNFSSLLNVTAFRIRFGEKFDYKYMVFFFAYGALMLYLAFL